MKVDLYLSELIVFYVNKVLTNMSSDDAKPSSWALVTVIVIIVITMFFVWQFFLSGSNTDDLTVLTEDTVVLESSLDEKANTKNDTDEMDNQELVIIEPDDITNTDVIDPVIDTPPLVIIPDLNESDSWVQKKLTSIIWRKELLELLINEDMIRRFVVFVDNFSQGNIAYSHSPFIKPVTKFTVKDIPTDNQEETWEFSESSFKRFSLYVDLFRSVDSETLVEWYQELKPLINEAYSELGYPEKEFDQVLQSAITKVLDLEFPKGDNKLVRPSVMFRYKSADIELLDDADKLMLRIGKDNLLIIKSVLLEINEKVHKDNYITLVM